MSLSRWLTTVAVVAAAAGRTSGSAQASPVATPRRSTWWSGVAGTVTIFALSVAAAIAMVETDRLLQGVTIDGRTGSLAQVESPLVAFGPGDVLKVWQTWHDVPGIPAFPLIVAHLLFDAALLVGYATLLLRLIGPDRTPARVLLWALVGAEAAEGAGVLTNALVLKLGGPVVPGLVWLTIGFTTVKWLLVVALVGALVRSPRAVPTSLRPQLLDVLVRSVRALFVQRLSIVVVLVLAVLGLLPFGEVFDQLPDVERTWADSISAGQAAGWLHAGMAVLLAVVVAAAAFVIGRKRAQVAWQREVLGWLPTTPAQYGWWLVGPALAAVAVLTLVAFGRADLVDLWPHLGIFVGVTVGLVLLHLPIERWYRGLWDELPRPRDEQAAIDIRRAGDALAVAIVVVAGLGLVRSFVAPILLALPGVSRSPVDGGRLAAQIAFLVIGVAVVAVVPGLGVRLAATVGTTPGTRAWQLLAPAAGTPATSRIRLALALGVPTGIFLLFVVLAPLRITSALGVVGTTMAVLGGWTLVAGFLVVGLQWHKPLAVFRLMHISANPVLTLTAAMLLATSAAGGAAPLHAVRTDLGATLVTARPNLAAVFRDWAVRSAAADCARPAGGTQAMPLLLVAASGGGIRSMAWTTRVMGTLAATPCGSAATLLSSGVSGGSIGLALSRRYGASPDPDAEVVRLAGPNSLAAAAAALFDGDVTATLTGIRLPAILDGEAQWADRAGLIERVWEQQGGTPPGPLAAPFNTQISGPAGALVLNSTAANLGCRVLVSQVDLAGSALDTTARDTVPVGQDPAPPCHDDRDGLPASTFDLLGSYGSCVPAMSWATAAMLSARFPFITPAGRIDCPGRDSLQLVDGGYAEGSGIATISDLAPDVMELVRDHNATALASGQPIVVPFLLYLEDETRTDLDSNPPGLAPELFVPFVGRDAAAQQRSSGSWTQRVADAIADPCPSGASPTCAAAVHELRGQVPDGIAVAAPLTEPAITAPLGWTLSSDSLAQLVPSTDERCPDGKVEEYACLGQLLTTIGGN